MRPYGKRGIKGVCTCLVCGPFYFSKSRERQAAKKEIQQQLAEMEEDDRWVVECVKYHLSGRLKGTTTYCRHIKPRKAAEKIFNKWSESSPDKPIVDGSNPSSTYCAIYVSAQPLSEC